jgi:hypothetical protein
MIQVQRNKLEQETISFQPKEDVEELVADLFRKLNGYHDQVRGRERGINTALDFSIDDTLETIDRLRSPLAGKRLDGQQLSDQELNRLEILNMLTEQILSLLMPEPVESAEVKLALEHARKLLT